MKKVEDYKRENWEIYENRRHGEILQRENL